MPTRDHDQLKLDVATALRDLERTLDRFIATLSHQEALASAEGGTTGPAALRRICTAYGAINYDSADEPSDSPVCLGVVGTNAAALAQAHDLNEAKAHLRDRVKVLRPYRVRVPVKDGQGGRVVKSLPLVRVILRELQRSDLNLLAAYRKIPVLTGRVQRVVYTRALTRAVYRKTRAEIAALLEASGRVTVPDDRVRLSRLPARETHLALVKQHYTNIRANVSFEGLDARNRGRVMIAAELPLLYPLGRSRTPPEIHYPDAADAERTTPVARAGKLEPEPFLESLPVYRYRPTPDRRRR
jgi:hypothetical protein